MSFPSPTAWRRAGALTLGPQGPSAGRPLAGPVPCAAFLCAPRRWLLDDPEITFSVEADELVRKSDWASDVGPQVESGTGDRIGYVRFLMLLLRPFMMCAQTIDDSPDRTVTEVRSRRFLAHGW